MILSLKNHFVKCACKMFNRGGFNTTNSLYTNLSLYENLLNFVNPITGIVHNLISPPQYNDEFPLFKSNCVFYLPLTGKVESSTGMGTSAFEAKFKSITEAIERYCTGVQDPSKQIDSEYRNIENAIDYRRFICLSKKCLRVDKYSPNDSDIFNWTKCFDIINNQNIWCPSQIIYVPYNLSNEKVLRLPITTGCASWSNKTKAIVKGIFELIERDAFMITWLCKRKANYEIKLSNHLQKKLMREDYKVRFYDISIDFIFPTVLCVVEDIRGKPKISIGLKTDINHLNACYGAFFEAMQVRSWIRDNLNQRINTATFKSHILKRGLLWSRERMYSNLEFIQPERKIKLKNYSGVSEKYALKKAINYFKHKKYDLFYCDLTLDELKSMNFYVVKCISPQLMPLYLDEKHKYLNCKRLADQYFEIYGYKPKENNYNRVVHPFM